MRSNWTDDPARALGRPGAVAPPPDLSIVILCRDEERTIAQCVLQAYAYLRRSSLRGEVVVVDNGSRDRSATLAQESGARVVRQPLKGVGIATRTGIQAARGQFVIIGDGDGEHDLNALDDIVEQLVDGFDFVVGNRFLGGGIDPKAMSFQRRVGNQLLSGLLKLLYRVPIGDCLCGLRGFSATAGRILAPKLPGFEAVLEMVIRGHSQHMNMTEVPITQYPSHPGRTSHLRPWRDGLRHLRLMISKRLHNR